MKRNVIFAIRMLVASFAVGQNRNVKEVKVTPPQFTGVENDIEVYNDSSAAVIWNYLKSNFVYSHFGLFFFWN